VTIGRALFWLGLAWLVMPHQPVGLGRATAAWRGDCGPCARLGQSVTGMLAQLRRRDLPRIRDELRAARR
jgi:hypothetical protein